MERKGIVLAGGRGTRLHPATKVTCKQLLPIYDKPMIYYAVSTLMECGIRDILLIVNPEDRILFSKLLGDGSHLGVRISYEVQNSPKGIADALLIAKEFLDGHPCAMILGDNLFFSSNLPRMVENAPIKGATIFAYEVSNPQDYGTVVLNQNGSPIRIVEKPKDFISNLAVTGFYLFDSNASKIAKSLVPSERGELEITDVNREYMRKGSLRVEKLGRGDAWLDTGTHDSLLSASEFVRTIQVRQGIVLGSPEEVAMRKEWTDRERCTKIVQPIENVTESEVHWFPATKEEMGKEFSAFFTICNEE